jgi:hypothetical protein
MTNKKYFEDGFSELKKTLDNTASIDELISSDNPNIEDLEKKLNEIAILANKERKEQMLQIILAWGFIISSLISIYSSIYISNYYYFLSVPLILITLIFLLFIFVQDDTFSGTILKMLKKLFFIHNSDLKDYVNGKKEVKGDTPIFTNIYRELQLKFKISQMNP